MRLDVLDEGQVTRGHCGRVHAHLVVVLVLFSQERVKSSAWRDQSDVRNLLVDEK